MKINYKSDFELDYTLLDEHGQPMTPPDCPWKLVLSIGNPLKPYAGQCDCINGRNFVASFDGTQYKNCTVADTVIRVFADNHGLPCGQLWATFITYTPNPDFPDGNRRVYTPQATDTFLVAEAGDDPTPAQIQYTANYVVFEHEYTAGQGINIENDVISATGESYTAGEGITIADGEIGLSQGTLDELESHDADIRDLITSVNSLERGNERAVRLTDTTTTGEAGKVVKVDETVVGTTYSRITADIFESKMVESDGGVCYAFPSSSNEVKTNADDMLLASGDKAELEEQINGKASSSDVTALGNRVTAVEGDITDLTVTDPALRQSDATISGEFDKVVKVEKFEVEGETPLGVIGADVVEATFVGNKDNGSFFAFPDSTQEVKTKADDTLLGQRDKTALEQQINGKASTSSVNAIDGRVTTLENTYEDTMNIANNQLHELIDGKAMIASALTDRGYPTAPTDSSASMAQKIENMAYDAGWLAQLGYSETNDGGVKEAVAYSKSLQEAYNSGAISSLEGMTYLEFCPIVNLRGTTMANFFKNCTRLTHVPLLDMSNITILDSTFYNCSSMLSVPKLNVSGVTSMSGTFESCSKLETIPKWETNSLTALVATFKSCQKLEVITELNIANCNTFTNTFQSATNIKFALFKGFGTIQSRTTYNEANTFKVLLYWGFGSEENRMSLVNSLLTYSFDRATAGYSSCTITLHANTLARLTAEEIAAITAKGYTLTS